jgi:hypothetical protein
MGESARDEAQWLPSALPLWELHLCESCQCLEPWLEREKCTKLGHQDTIRKVLKRRCFKCPHIVHLYMIFMSYDQKKRQESNWEFDSQPQILESKSQMRSNWGMLYVVIKIFLRFIRYCHRIFRKKTCFEKHMSIQSFGATRVPILGLPFGNFGEKWHLDVVPMSIKVYYREGSGASSQSLWVV